jgi:broad specificity phosphatase PhoE
VGATDVPLRAEGISQSARLAAGLGRRRPTRCYCSPLARTQQTARIISESIGLSVTTDRDLREINFGEWEGMTFDQAAARHPEAVARWASFSDDFAFPGGESLRDFLERIQRTADRLAADPSERILVITHGGVIRAMICHLLGLSPRSYVLFEIQCAAVSTIKLFDGRGVLAGLNELSTGRGN